MRGDGEARRGIGTNVHGADEFSAGAAKPRKRKAEQRRNRVKSSGRGGERGKSQAGSGRARRTGGKHPPNPSRKIAASFRADPAGSSGPFRGEFVEFAKRFARCAGRGSETVERGTGRKNS